jgi:CheY-like chemotaxis protein
MDTLANQIDRPAPVGPDTRLGDLAGLFAAAPTVLALAVVADGRPIGLVGREACLAHLRANPAQAALPVSQIMEAAPLIAEAGLSPRAFEDQILAATPAGLALGFIVVEDGRYLGVGSPLSLLIARRDRNRDLKETNAAVTQTVAAETLRQLEAIADLSARLSRLSLSSDAQACARAIGETSDDIRRLMHRAAMLHAADVAGLPLTPAPHKLQDLMDAVAARWVERAEAAGVTLLASYDGEPDFQADIDAEQLLEIFDALIGRAIGESRRGAVEVSLKARLGPEGLALEGRVRDGGRELEAGQLAGMFEPLTSRDLKRMPDFATAIGMTLAGRIVTAMNGSIRAEANVGAGVTVAFDLAVAEARQAEPPPAPVNHNGALARILIVDDNATNRMVAEALCEMFDCASAQAGDGVEALQALETGSFDLILMDIKMPRMDGVAATRAIRALPDARSRIPIIALTANADPDDVKGYLAAGMNDVVEKPIKPDRLLAALDALLPATEGSDHTQAA